MFSSTSNLIRFTLNLTIAISFFTSVIMIIIGIFGYFFYLFQSNLVVTKQKQPKSAQKWLRISMKGILILVLTLIVWTLLNIMIKFYAPLDIPPLPRL